MSTLLALDPPFCSPCCYCCCESFRTEEEDVEEAAAAIPPGVGGLVSVSFSLAWPGAWTRASKQIPPPFLVCQSVLLGMVDQSARQVGRDG